MKQLHELQPGERMSIGDKIYGRCTNCLEVIRLNKFLFGSMHLCNVDPRTLRQDWHCTVCGHHGPIGSKCTCKS